MSADVLDPADLWRLRALVSEEAHAKTRLDAAAAAYSLAVSAANEARRNARAKHGLIDGDTYDGSGAITRVPREPAAPDSAELARMWEAAKAARVPAAAAPLPPDCGRCHKGWIDGGNNDFTCSCPAGIEAEREWQAGKPARDWAAEQSKGANLARLWKAAKLAGDGAEVARIEELMLAVSR